MEAAERDLDLAVELINTYWVLADPPERLTDAAVYQRILREAGEADLAAALAPGDLGALLDLRARIRPVFAAPGPAEAVAVLDSLLSDAAIPIRLAAGSGTARWDWGAGLRGMAALRARLLAALAAYLVRHGTIRLGVCQASPCDSVYVDRSRARTRRYCCDQCNDRAAAAAYRSRLAIREGQAIREGRGAPADAS
jgi:predicted RNA-binding Zn ribbon-like protein